MSTPEIPKKFPMTKHERLMANKPPVGQAPILHKFNLISAKDLYDLDIPPIEYLIDTLLCRGSIIYLVGKPGTFKTGYMILMALCGACGKDFIDFNTKEPFKTLFIDEENGIKRTKFKLNRLVDGLDMDIDVLNGKVMFANISGFRIIQDWIDTVVEYIEGHHPDLIVIDNIARCIVGSERDEELVSKIQALLKPVTEKYDVTFTIIHHLRKTDRQNHHPKSLEDISGSRDFGGQSDAVFCLDFYTHKKDEHKKIFKLLQFKEKDGEEMEPINFAVIGDAKAVPPTPLVVKFDSTIHEKVESKMSETRFAVVKWWTDNPAEKYKTSVIIATLREMGHGDTYIRRSLKQLLKDGVLTYKHPEYYWVKIGDEK